MLTQSDYSCIGLVAKHCDNDKLCIAENEALSFDLPELYCDIWQDILDIWEEIDEYIAEVEACEANPECTTPPVEPENYDFKYKLIYGGTYVGCNDKTRQHEGIKKQLVYYSYSRYVIINGYSDTPTGLKAKTNEYSLPIPLKELQSYGDKYRNMGKIAFERTVGYMCANSELINWTDCKKCGCGCSKCGGHTKAKGYGYKSSIITKDIWRARN